MGTAATLLVCLAVGGLFGWQVSLERLLNSAQVITSPLSIIAAGLLVRLNRTMPSLSWESIDRNRRERLTAAIVDLTQEYLVIFAVVAAFLLLIIGLVVVGNDAIFGRSIPDSLRHSVGWPEPVLRVLSGAIGFLGTLVVTRTGYVVWRDYDIARLQKAVIDAAAFKAHQDHQERVARDNLDRMSEAGLRPSARAAHADWEDPPPT
ncbi:MAG TPA: hypothetical protein VHZ26_04780 [Caulobacteraceae bacterium]|jgi:protein-S-isoprenylcysteine O-methyltransferase Ste14|nr:hypothetical protein [Caulobacteraceae bacterium]